MKNFNWRKYTFAFYMLILAIAIILALIGVNNYSDGNSYQTLLLSIATELAGAVLIFTLVKQIFSLDDDQKESMEKLDDRIQLLQTEIHSKFNSLVPRSILGIRFHFGKLLQDAESVILLGYTHSGLVRTYKKSSTCN
jgi:hypothetical protein